MFNVLVQNKSFIFWKLNFEVKIGLNFLQISKSSGKFHVLNLCLCKFALAKNFVGLGTVVATVNLFRGLVDGKVEVEASFSGQKNNNFLMKHQLITEPETV